MPGERDKLDPRVRGNRRKFDIIKKLPMIQSAEEMRQLLSVKPKGRRLIFRFLMSPIELHAHHNKISKITFQKNFLQVSCIAVSIYLSSCRGACSFRSVSLILQRNLRCLIAIFLLRSIGYQADPICEG